MKRVFNGITITLQEARDIKGLLEIYTHESFKHYGDLDTKDRNIAKHFIRKLNKGLLPFDGSNSVL